MIIVMAHEKGGVGKTTAAINIADEIKPALIIDRDTHGNIGVLNSLRPDSEKFNVREANSENELISLLEEYNKKGHILVDCGGFDSDINSMAIAAADLLIVPANDDINEKIGLMRFDETLSRVSEQMGKKIVGHVLFNRTHPSRKNFGGAEDFISESNHLVRLKSVLPRRNDFPLAAANGKGVSNFKKTRKSKSALEVKALGKEIESFKSI
ncbi:ParA family protein [Pseudoalteromonas sp. MMG024]|uniref:ParA family protein n=1 Tax=Pseudoalteromonas sp. MMG024 TaxID=2909980 RepID=UPI001F2A2B39|nr:ParA family protein [Pseudoalteromonas sp. MMG024]MCF6459096.1 ParA family protein [Pseudoalteromonas sp. MMG024]